MLVHFVVVVKRFTPESIPTIAIHDPVISVIYSDMYDHFSNTYMVLDFGYAGILLVPGCRYIMDIAQDTQLLLFRYDVYMLVRSGVPNKAEVTSWLVGLVARNVWFIKSILFRVIVVVVPVVPIANNANCDDEKLHTD